MKASIPIRWKLTIWYGLILLAALGFFAVISYNLISRELYDNLDESIVQISETLHDIIESSGEGIYKPYDETAYFFDDKFALFKKEKRRRFIGPLRPDTSYEREPNKDLVWSAIFKHILLNPQNYFIQITDTSDKIVWRSKNLPPRRLPYDVSYWDNRAEKSFWKRTAHFDNVVLDDKKFRLLINPGKYATVSIAYTVSEVEGTLNKLFLTFLWAIPFIFLASVLGGSSIAKMTLSRVDRVTKAAKEISARNLSLRLDKPKQRDEIGRLVETFNDMISRLDKSFSQIKRFTSDASHELRTPLTILRGEIEVALKKERSSEEYQQTLNSALEEVMRLSQLVETLLDLSKVDSSREKLDLKENNLSILIAEILEDMEIISESKQISLKSDIEPEVAFPFDKARMHQAVLNLVDNAVKYTPEDGDVSVSLDDRGHYVEIAVSDTGIGMTHEELSRVFDRFYRVDEARGADVKGSGLGLSIVNWIVKAHRGKIVAKSQYQFGSTFHILLPKEPGEDIEDSFEGDKFL